jgi:hypothetical protein
LPIDGNTLADLKQQVQDAIKEHSPTADSVYHNGGTILALAATSTATIVPSDHWIWAKIVAALATFLIAVSRALDFGGRWRWHIEMQANYRALLDRVNEVSLLPKDAQLDALKRVYDKLEALRLREGGIPGAGAPSSKTG